ncbi:MAG: hypothetical protein VX704_02495, partial [Verrucomicrobiota bacterium]|nr:hypothetical protein [Verrucomicrobiota bacterium]
ELWQRIQWSRSRCITCLAKLISSLSNIGVAVPGKADNSSARPAKRADASFFGKKSMFVQALNPSKWLGASLHYSIP